MREILPGIWSWSIYSEARKIDFNSFLLMDATGNVLIDPVPLVESDREEIERLGRPGTILLTNRDHVRLTPVHRESFKARVGIHELDAPLIDFKPDFVFRDGDVLPGSLTAVHLPENKSPGETALLWRRQGGILILGDALIGRPSGELGLLPPEKYADVGRAQAGLRRLLDLPFESILIGDGPLTPVRGRSALQRFLERG